jgi:hypothetical protein
VHSLCFSLASPIICTGRNPCLYNYNGKLPQLAYSAGEDRLGSAKMGYIDTSVVMKVLDTVRNLYKVQLSALHYAFLEKSYAQPFPDTMLSTVLCESWRVKGEMSLIL